MPPTHLLGDPVCGEIRGFQVGSLPMACYGPGLGSPT